MKRVHSDCFTDAKKRTKEKEWGESNDEDEIAHAHRYVRRYLKHFHGPLVDVLVGVVL